MWGEMGVFILHGFIGGVLWLFVHWQWSKKAIAQHTFVSAIAGYLYWLLHSEYNFPNGFMAIISGYASVDFIKQIVEVFGRKRR
ncbi:MAG: hypothetical protein DRP27_05335 [Thermotogae bacterium]|nr:MAG: hypothetical protein DRP27_05335 [Thermotogota bacterium]